MTKVIAILAWGDVIEDYLQPIGLTVEDFCDRMDGGWLFNYVLALKSAGWSPLILLVSSSVRASERRHHRATGTPIWLIPGRSFQTIARPELRAVRQWLDPAIWRIRERLRREGCESLLVQEYEWPRFDALAFIGRAMNLPVFATYQGGDQTLSALERAVRRRSIACVTGLIIPSAEERRRMVTAYGVDCARIAAIANPVHAAEWRPIPRLEARASLGLPSDKFIAIYHGRIDIHRKGLDLLLRAWSGPGELVLIGDGQDREQLRPMIQGRADVRWIEGYTMDRSIVRRWLSAANLYVSASRLEGMPVAPLEAMATGLPVIASDAKGLADIFSSEDSGGILFPSGDVEALSQAIYRLRTDPALRARFGALARRHVEDRFSIAAVGRQLDLFLRSAMGAGPSERAGSPLA